MKFDCSAMDMQTKTVKMSLLMVLQETGTILRPRVVFRDTGKRAEKPGQSLFSGTSGHLKWVGKVEPPIPPSYRI